MGKYPALDPFSSYKCGGVRTPSVAPYLTVSPALAAIAYYTTVFGAQQKPSCRPSTDCAWRPLRADHQGFGSVMLADAFPELGHTRMSVPGELVTTSVSLEYSTAQEVDEVFAKATGLGGDQPLDQILLGHAFCDLPRSVRPSLDSLNGPL